MTVLRKGLMVAGLTMMLAGLVTPVWAEHNAPNGTPNTSVNLDVDLRVHRDGFRLGGQLRGLAQSYGAWLNGEVRPDGLRLDGRVEDGGRAFNFTLNAEILEWLLGSARRNPI